MLETLADNIIPQDDEQRLEALRRFEILYTTAEAAFDNITQMMAEVFDTPMAFISLVDKEKVFYKSQVGPFGRDHVQREDSLCSLTILGTEPLIIEDASGEACFQDNPYVAAEGGIRFYAGAPLITSDGYQIGTACIVDTKRRTFSEKDKNLLIRFAKIVMHEIEVRRVAILQRDAEEALLISKERFGLVAKATQDAVWDWNLLTDEIWWNEGFKELFGYKQEEIEPTIVSWYNRVHPEDRDWVVNGIHDVIDKGGRNWSAEYRFRKADGSYTFVFDRGYALHDSKGHPYRMLGSMQDITERKNAESAIRQSEMNLRNIVMQSPVAMCILTGDSFVVEVANQRILELMGKEAEEMMGRPVFDVLVEAGEQGLKEIMQQVYTSGERFVANERPVLLPRNGKIETTYINFAYEPFRGIDGAIAGVMAVGFDVTDQVVARMKVEEANKELQFVTDTMPQLVWATESNGYAYFFNKGWLDYTGLSFEEVKGEGWLQSLHPDDREQTIDAWTQALEKGIAYGVEYRVRRYDGAYRWFLTRGAPMKDGKGKILKWYGTTTDVDDQKKAEEALETKVKERTAELEKSNQELVRLNKNLEEFAYAASHDLKEPVRKIHVFSERLKDSLGIKLSESERHYFNRIGLASRRMTTLIDDLLMYTEVSQTAVLNELVDLNVIINYVLSDLDLEIEEKGAAINVGKLFIVKGHRRQLQQAFQNLIGNALKYCKPELVPVISITCSKVNGRDTGLQLSLEDQMKAFYQVTVKDNGIGFDQADSDRIFNVFTRLHGMAEYKGTGIGLSIVRKVIENHRGHIWAESRPGEGATFKILLPTD